MENRRKKKAHCLRSQAGVTLVELVVTFAILTIFLTGTTQCITGAIRTYHVIRNTENEIQVADTLLEKIASEIESAQVAPPEMNTDESTSNAALKITTDGQKISFYDKTGAPVVIEKNASGELVIQYGEISTKDQNGNKKIQFAAVDWKFDQNAYMGFQIQELKFERAYAALDDDSTDKLKNIIKITLRLGKDANSKGIERVRYVECYNFTTDDDFHKIDWNWSGTTGGTTGGTTEISAP